MFNPIFKNNMYKIIDQCRTGDKPLSEEITAGLYVESFLTSVLVFTVYISLEYILLLCCFMLNPVFNQSQYDTFGLIFPRTSFLMLFPSNSTRDNLGEIQHHNW